MGGLSPALLPLLTELNDLKRIRSAGRDGSLATRLFRQAWSGLVGGRPLPVLAMEVTMRALAAARLGDIDRAVLEQAGLSRAQINRVLQQAIAQIGTALPPVLHDAALAAAAAERPQAPTPLPDFVARLEAQPRAGLTCPGRPRIMLEPPENHAEHCLMVAVYGVILSPLFGASPETVFVAGLAHHLHNAVLPDSGFTGEVLLGAHLDRVMARATEACLGALDEAVRTRVVAARAVLADAATPEGRAFHAADVIDRVLQIRQYLEAAALTMDRVVGEMSLVHEGSVKGFHDDVLARVGLA